MTRDQVLADLDQRFAAHMAAEAARMKAEGMSSELISAVLVENERRFATMRERSADWVLSCTGVATNDNAAVH